MSLINLVLAFLVLTLIRHSLAGQVCNIVDYGAVGDGATMNTKAVIGAIAACEGGTYEDPNIVVVPSGNFLSAPFNLTSNMIFLVEPNAVLIATNNSLLWPVVPPLPSYCVARDNGAPYRYQGFVSGTNLSNVVITGGGLIDGQGLWWWEARANNTLPVGRGSLVELMWVQNLTVSNISLQNSPFWTLHPYVCDNVLIEYVNITTFPLEIASNTDGIDPDSSTNVHIHHCTIDTKDDHIAVKSGLNECGREFNKSATNITVEDCEFLSGFGLTVGSETSGGIHNVTFKNSVIRAGQAVRLKTMRGRGGVINQVQWENLNLIYEEDDPYSPEVQVLFVTEFYQPAEPTNLTATPILMNLLASNLTGNAQIAGCVLCLPEMPCSGMQLMNINIAVADDIPYNCTNVEGEAFDNNPPFCNITNNPELWQFYWE